ncbi:MAG TPA: alpha/beta fold hydrolase [Nitrososphaeraceae archaeon]
MVVVNPGYSWKNRDVLYVSITITAVFLIAMSVSILSESTLHHNTTIAEAYAQPYVETVKNRNLTIDLGNGLKTNAQLTYPATGKGPYPGVIIFPGAGAGSVITPSNAKAIYYGHLAEYLSERGFAVLRYDKRGVGPNFTISDSNAWGNLTFDNLKQDAEKALSVLLQQPEVNATKKATLIGHSEGTNFPPRIAADNPDKVRNIVLMAPVAEKWTYIIYFQEVLHPLLYAENILDKGHPGQISVKEASKDPIFQKLVGGNLTQLLLNPTNVTDNNRTVTLPERKNNTTADLISIEGVLKPALVRGYENDTSPNASQLSEKCIDLVGCPSLGKSFSALPSVIGMIGNVSSNIGILILEGQNDSQTPLQQALLLQQRLTEANHPDHQIIVYPDLGHNFVPSNQWISSNGLIPEYVLQDLFEWLSSPSRQK